MNVSLSSGAAGTPSNRILDAVAAQTDSDPVDLPPLYDTIDPEVLDSLVETMDNGAISFTYAGHEITVAHDGELAFSD
ncbi:HalOD1 output domain-containing protein [Halobacterium sp. R2-5]|uniref:HalOD1 output domain-containing protein n=1 Tax=Halobacterium sp. R2-5 TaxID=2715751 RepID=UPI003263A55F